MHTTDISTRWPTVRLSELIADATNGLACGERDPDGTLQIRMNNVGTDGSLDLGDVLRIPASPNQISRYCLQPGDVLFNNTNSTELVGKSTIFAGHNEPVLFSNHFTRIRTHRDRLAPSYLARWLTKQQQADVFARLCNRWVNQSAIRKEALLGLTIPLPPLVDQNRIAAILDQADAIRRKRCQTLDVAHDLIPAAFYDAFGDPNSNDRHWPVMEFGQVCDTRLGKMLDAKQQTGLCRRPYMRNINVQWGRLDLSSMWEMDFNEQDRKEFRLEPGDVLICEGGAGVGQTAIWRGEISECYFQKSLHRVRPKRDRAIPEYIETLIWALMKGGAILQHISQATIPHLTGVKLKTLQIPVPPMSRQQRFAATVAQMRRLHTSLERGCDQADVMFASVSSRAFQAGL